MYVQRQKLVLIFVMTDVIKRKKKLASTAKPSYTCVQVNSLGFRLKHSSQHRKTLKKIHVQAKRKEPAICPNLQNINLPSLLIR